MPSGDFTPEEMDRLRVCFHHTRHLMPDPIDEQLRAKLDAERLPDMFARDSEGGIVASGGSAVAVCEVCGGFERTNEPCLCLHVLAAFAAVMETELRDNAGKHGRAAWRTADPDWMMFEIHDHAAKLHVAFRELRRRRNGAEPRTLPWGDRSPESLVREFAADTANMALMLLDSLELLDEAVTSS